MPRPGAADDTARRARRRSAIERAISAKARAKRRRAGGARGYSVAVRWLKILLPLAALATLSLLFLLPRSDFVGGLILSGADLAALRDGLRLNEPRFSGSTDHGEPFSISADWALPDSPNPSRIELSAVVGEIVLTGGRSAGITAPDGALRPRDRSLTLSGGVELSTSDGYVLRTDAAEADMASRIIRLPGPLTGKGAGGELQAGSMRAWSEGAGPDGQGGAGRNGYIIRFEGGVRVVFQPGVEPNDAD